MKLYAPSLGAGLLVGIVYSLLSVRSPAPPLVALVRLLGILIGEHVLSGAAFTSACCESQATDHVLGQLPGRHGLQPPHPAGEKPS